MEFREYGCMNVEAWVKAICVQYDVKWTSELDSIITGKVISILKAKHYKPITRTVFAQIVMNSIRIRKGVQKEEQEKCQSQVDKFLNTNFPVED